MRLLLAIIFSFVLLLADVDINSANKKELMSLSGVGVKKAQKIIAYRETNGCFLSLEDLMKVKGIGEKTFEKNKELLILGECLK